VDRRRRSVWLVLVVGLWPGAVGSDIDLSDWDWSGVGDEPARPAPRSPAASAKPPQPRGDGTPAPDLAATPRPAIALFAGLPPFLVVPGVRDAAMHPCGSCHRWTESDPTLRVLKEPHDRLVLRHGLRDQGQFWCFTCHQLAGDSGLRTLEGEAIGRDGAY